MPTKKPAKPARPGKVLTATVHQECVTYSTNTGFSGSMPFYDNVWGSGNALKDTLACLKSYFKGYKIVVK